MDGVTRVTGKYLRPAELLHLAGDSERWHFKAAQVQVDVAQFQIEEISIMIPMKSLQEWAADCIAKSLLNSLCVTRLAISAFRCSVDSSQREN
ncbi:hypothetical protein E2C01_033250 [Portunus trituberculatus]|uniref:Uncharacterized protein n=1 Tax=Portunus trituberculatus TaxID=210409 RepID=A0A5B7F1Y7_PORTR|nr:hypothetical protein [Portunus trituberculatus]